MTYSPVGFEISPYDTIPAGTIMSWDWGFSTGIWNNSRMDFI